VGQEIQNMSSVAEDVLLKYPFVGADNIEKAAVGLPLCNTDDGDLSTLELVLVSLQLEKSVGKNSVQIITQDDRDKKAKGICQRRHYKLLDALVISQLQTTRFTGAFFHLTFLHETN
jgi:hypothetical protein